MKKTMTVLLAAGLATGAVWKWTHHGSAQPADGARLAYDRLWIDHVPKNDRDTIAVFVALTEEPVGVFQATSQWKGNFELFQYEGRGSEIEVVYPQTGDKEKVTLRAKACDDERHMDYCLEVSGASRGVEKYYSREGWEVGSVDDKAIQAKLAHAAD